MTQRISIENIGGNNYSIGIIDADGSESTHTVFVNPEYIEKLGWDTESTEDLLKKSFEFLLERESKESILSSFDLKDISKYFLEYEEHMRKS